MTARNDDAHDADEKRICFRCVHEEYLSGYIKKSGASKQCDYCSKKARSISIEELADEVEAAFGRHFYRTATEPSAFEYAMYKESDTGWERSGEPVKYAIANAAGIPEEAADDVAGILEGRHWDKHSERAGEETEFDSESFYEERGVDDESFRQSWQQLERSLREETRLFNSAAKEILDSVFEGLDQHATSAGRGVLVDAGPKCKISAVYRARVFQSEEKLEAALKRPDLELGPPPSAVAVAGRMNSRGISIFYGATTSRVAIAETRPPVGSKVLVGRFSISRPIRLLDIEAFQAISVQGSIFDSEYARRLEKAKFLGCLSSRITAPVMPDHEPLEYVVTQAIADYLATMKTPSIDGLIYSSVQNGGQMRNIALFHKAAKVAPLDLPEGTEVEAHLYETDDEGTHPDYSVWELTPESESAKETKDEWDFTPPNYDPAPVDERDVTLRLVTNAVRVHHIERATYKAQDYSVSRRRMKRQKLEF